MKITRIKYHSIPGNSNIKISNTFFLNRKLIYVIVDYNLFTFEVLEKKNGILVVSGGDCKNRQVLLRQVKRALIKLGLKFEKEQRKNETKR